MSHDWQMFLTDMLDGCHRIQGFTRNMTLQAFTRDEKTYWATIKMVEIIGEAARHIPADVRVLVPGIPWSRITAARNALSHGYFGINDDVLWEIVQVRIPELERELITFLSEQKEGE